MAGKYRNRATLPLQVRPAAAAALLLGTTVVAVLLLPQAAAAPLSMLQLLPGLTTSFRGPVSAVAEAVRAYPVLFRTARERLALRDPGSEGSLSTTNSLLSIKIKDICPTIKEVTYMSAGVSCLAMNTLETALRNRRAPGSPSECVNKNETGYGEQVEPSKVSLADGTPAPVPLPDLRPLPPAFTPRRTRALMYSEGATWAWHWGVINNILAMSMCAKGGGGSLDFLVPDGWEPVGPGSGDIPGIYDLIQTDGSPPMPFMAILRTKKGSVASRTAEPAAGGAGRASDDAVLARSSAGGAFYRSWEEAQPSDGAGAAAVNGTVNGTANATAADAGNAAAGNATAAPAPPANGTSAAAGGGPVNGTVAAAGMTASEEQEDGQLAIVFRGTNSGPEWMLDFQYHRIPRSLFPGPHFKGNYFDGETHAGFSAVFNMVWPHVRRALEQQVLSGPKLRHVSVSGHSLGAATATLVSYAAQRFLDAHDARVKVDAVMVASPNVGNLAFVQSHAELVNSRRITFMNDAVTMVPCAGGGEGRGMPACNMKASYGGRVSVWTDYYSGYAAISLTPKDMPVQVAAWDNTERLPLFDIPTAEALTGALHVCSYECFFSRWSDKTRAAQSSCLLVPPTLKESAAHSFCYGFPIPGFQPRQ